MKLDIHGIRFRFWLICMGLAFGITLLIGVLQIGLIRPYYRNSKMRSVSQIADMIMENLVEDDSNEAIDDTLRQTVNNNVCVLMYNQRGNVVYTADSLGNGCLFNNNGLQNIEGFSDFETLRESLTQNTESSMRIVNELTGQDMVLYARSVQANLSNYYLLVNAPLEPVDSIVTFFTKQYGLYTLIAIMISSFVSFGLSTQVTRPIIRMKYQAQKLSEADYTASFDGGSFTETKELAQALNIANDKLGRLEENRRDLMANVSHDIRTPLTDIRAYAEMIRDISGDNPEKREKHLDVIIRETDYMNHLINDMTELTKMQSGSYVLHQENIDLYDTIHNVVEMNAPLAQKAGVHTIIEVEKDLVLYADRIKVSQVIANYYSNAIKHSPPDTTITITANAKDEGETIRIQVKDEGEGIAKEDLPHIWDRYQKSSKSFSRNMTSTGLGLSIVKAIADVHGARCGVTSEKGKGSTFWIEFQVTHEA